MPNRADIVGSPIEYALYALASQHPDLFTEAERFCGGMLTEDREAMRRVRAMLRDIDRLEEHSKFLENEVNAERARRGAAPLIAENC